MLRRPIPILFFALVVALAGLLWFSLKSVRGVPLNVAHAATGPACAVPAQLPRPQAEAVDPTEANPVLVTGYTLALSWSPQFCRNRKDDPAQATQCRANPSFGFIVHGLWPDGQGRNDPAWCGAGAVLSEKQVRSAFCMMPSPQLQQHEWAKHGTCMTQDPARYFSKSAELFNALVLPDMDGLSRAGTTGFGLVAAFSEANPALDVNGIDVAVTEGGWLKEVRLCYDETFQSVECEEGLRNGDRALRIWRPVK